MQTFLCTCDNTLFFESDRCVRCNAQAGLCPKCLCVVASKAANDGSLICGNPDCGQSLKPCSNYVDYQVCNCFLGAEESEQLCGYCRLNSVIPDLTIDENLDKWRKLEAAKRRVLRIVQAIGLPLSPKNDPPLNFVFKADTSEQVFTGHADGCITINLKEADPVERERARVDFSEPQRTLVGHFRHELGHYYWDAIVKHRRLQACRELFGDDRADYEDAKARYYSHGPQKDWQSRFISAYASMHPWEDFAETFNTYLDMVTVLTTTNHFQITNVPHRTFEKMIAEYQRVGILANELCRDMGIGDLVPEVICTPAAQKLRFIHQLAS